MKKKIATKNATYAMIKRGKKTANAMTARFLRFLVRWSSPAATTTSFPFASTADVVVSVGVVSVVASLNTS